MKSKLSTTVNKISFLKNNEQLNLIIAVMTLCILLGLMTDTFFTIVNLKNLLRQVSIVGITGLGAYIVILCGEWDLSIGALQAAGGCLVVYLLNHVFGGMFFLPFAITILLGIVIGYINGLLVAKANINSFIATLGTMSMIKGAVFVMTNAASIQNRTPNFDWLGTGEILGLPVPLVIFIILCLVVYYLLHFTVFGRNVFAVGGNTAAAKASGINVDKIKIIAFAIGGGLAALTSIISASRMNSGQPSTGTGFELMVISAVVLGGTSLAGGRGKILGCILGILILNILNNGLILMNVSSFYQEIVRGAVILIAVYVDGRRRQNEHKRLLRHEPTQG